VKLERMLRRTTVLLRRTTTVLSACQVAVSFCWAGRVTEGNHGHASLRLPNNGSGSFHGHRNGRCDAPQIGAVKSLLSALPTAAPNGWHSKLASNGWNCSRARTTRLRKRPSKSSLNGLENGLKGSLPEAVSFVAGVSSKLQRNSPLWAYLTHAGWPLYSRG
jgi:hypothetical protein